MGGSYVNHKLLFFLESTTAILFHEELDHIKLLQPWKLVSLYKFHTGNNHSYILSLKTQIIVGIKDFNSHKFTRKKYISGQNYSGLATRLRQLLVSSGYIRSGLHSLWVTR